MVLRSKLTYQPSIVLWASQIICNLLSKHNNFLNFFGLWFFLLLLFCCLSSLCTSYPQKNKKEPSLKVTIYTVVFVVVLEKHEKTIKEERYLQTIARKTE